MSKTLLHRLFGIGKIPRRYAPTLDQEGIVIAEEGIGGSLTLRKLRAPGRYHSWKRSWFTGSVVLSEQTFAAFALFKPLIYVPLADPRIRGLRCSIEGGTILCVGFDAAVFHDGWSGTVEVRLKTAKARLLLERLQQVSGRTG
jgi:hypothetical protein